MSAMATTISVCQLNMNGKPIVSVQLLEHCQTNDVDVLLLQETPLTGNKISGFEFDSARVVMNDIGDPALAAIVVLNPDIEVVAIRDLTDRFFAVASVRKGMGRSVVLISSYFKYSLPTQGFVRRLGHILNNVGDNVVIGADVNAHSTLWFSRPGNNSGFARGTRVEELLREQHLRVENRPGYPETYLRPGMGSSNIDVTLSRRGGIHHSVQGWAVVADLTDSDHRLLRFSVRCGDDLSSTRSDSIRYNVKWAD